MSRAATGSPLVVSLATTEADLRAVQALRYQVFVRELGSGGDGIDHANGLECDRFDTFAEHLVAREVETGSVVGVYRLMRESHAQAAGQFYSEDEYDLTALRQSGRRLLELGRSCVHADWRGGTAMYHLWTALADYVADHGIEVLFGVASFHGTDPGAVAGPLSLLHERHLAPPDLRPRAHADSYQHMDLLAGDALDRRAAMVAMPALIKAYLRLGGMVGEGAWIDRSFNTIDVCMVLDTARMNARQKRLYTGGRE